MWNHYPSQPNLTQQCKSTLWGSQSCPWWRRRRGSTWWMCRGRWRRQSRRRSRWSRKSVPDPAKLRLCRFVHKLVRHMACKSFTLKVFVHTYLEVGWLVSVWENCIFCLGFGRKFFETFPYLPESPASMISGQASPVAHLNTFKWTPFKSRMRLLAWTGLEGSGRCVGSCCVSLWQWKGPLPGCQTSEDGFRLISWFPSSSCSSSYLHPNYGIDEEEDAHEETHIGQCLPE